MTELVRGPKVTVRMPPRFAEYAGGAHEWEVSGSTVAEALAAACDGHADLRERIFEANGGIRSYIRVFVHDEQAGPQTPLEDEAVVRVLPALGGGRGEASTWR